jgi:hypothetical protein
MVAGVEPVAAGVVAAAKAMGSKSRISPAKVKAKVGVA